MKIDIRDNFSPESFYQGMSEPTGLGAFDQDEPEVRKFDNPCPVCGKSLDYEGNTEDMCSCEICVDCGKLYDDCRCVSSCCTAPIIYSDICSRCGEHCI